MNIQSLLNRLVKWDQGMEDQVSAYETCENVTVKMTRQTGTHSKELQAQRDKFMDLETQEI